MPVTSVRLHSASADAVPILLAATVYMPDQGSLPFPGMVVGHGAGSRSARHEDFCRVAAGLGFVVLALDFRGHGDSEGVADGPLEDDVTVAAAFLRRHRAVDASRICYRGSSMGGFYGLKAAPYARFAAMALLCPAGEAVMLEGLGRYETRDTEDPASGGAGGPWPPPDTRWDLPGLKSYFVRQDSLAVASHVRCPVLLVHAREDEVVPLSHSLALAEHLAGDATLVALAGGSHTSAQHDPEIHRLTAGWLLQRVTSACTGRT